MFIHKLTIPFAMRYAATDVWPNWAARWRPDKPIQEKKRAYKAFTASI